MSVIRVKSSAVLLLVWLSVPVSFTYISLNLDMGSFPAITLIVSILFFVLGIGIYMGNAQAVAGFNTMSPDELEQYDLNKVSIFYCLSWFIASLVVYHGWGLASSTVGNLGGAVFSIAACLAIVVASSVFLACGKRFRAKDD